MPKLLEKLKSLKHLNVEKDVEGCDDVLQTPTNPSVKQAEALLKGRGSASPAHPAGETEINVIQTPTSQAVREAQGDTDLLDRRRTVSFLSSFTSRISRAKSFHASASDLQKLDGAAPPRARLLTFSKSQPDLKAAESVDPPPKGLVVLGKEARRRSRRYILSEDGTLNSNLIAEPSAASMPARTVEKSLASVPSGLYKVLKPMRSPFADVNIDWQGSSTLLAAEAAGTPGTDSPQLAQSGSPGHPGRERRRISRKISSCKLIISTDPLEEKPGDIMLDPEVVEFASGALEQLGGHYTGEIEFSGKSARVARRLSRSATVSPDAAQQHVPVVGVTA